MEKSTAESILACLKNADKEFARDFAKQRIITVRDMIEAGFVENLLDAPIIRNLINLLAPFIKNNKVKSAIKLLQEGLTEEKKKEDEAKKPIRTKSSIDEIPKVEVKINELE
jgi:hypothetical protein